MAHFFMIENFYVSFCSYFEVAGALIELEELHSLEKRFDSQH